MKRIFLILSLAFIFLLPELHAKKNKWNGSTGTNDWNTEANWDDGVPDFGDDAIIPADLFVYPVIVTGDIVNVKKLTIEGILTMDDGFIYHKKEFKVEEGGLFIQNGGLVYGTMIRVN